MKIGSIGACDICHKEIQANNPVSLNRVMGYHKRRHHGIQGVASTPAGRRAMARARHWRLAGMSPKQIEERESQFLLKHPESGINENNGNEPVARKKKPVEEVTPVGLKECPNCGCRFYMARSNSENES